MGLAIRMILYALGAGAAGAGLASFDEATGNFTVNLDDLAVVIGGALTYVATFIASRIAKARGGKT